MTDPEEAALLRAITTAPGDRTARLAYIDWLQEHARSIEAAWVREEDVRPPLVTRIAGFAHGDGDGLGRGHGDGYGDKAGDSPGPNNYILIRGTNSEGNGKGDGNTTGTGFITGIGFGFGRGSGFNRDRDRDYGDEGPTSLFSPRITNEEVHMPAFGEYVIVRSRGQGCVCGEYRSHHGREVALGKARQIFSWEGLWWTLINFAVTPERCRLSREAPGEVVMLEACGIIPTTPEVETFLRAHPGE